MSDTVDIKQLDRHTVCQLFEINSPIWNGGQRKVGLNINRIGKHNEIRFLYRRKSDGELSIPDTYYFDGDLAKQLDYEVQNTHGVSLLLVPISDLKVLERV